MSQNSDFDHSPSMSAQTNPYPGSYQMQSQSDLNGISLLSQAATHIESQISQNGSPGHSHEAPYTLVKSKYKRKKSHSISSSGSSSSTFTVRETDTHNRFDPLSFMNDENMDSDSNHAEKIPPIYIPISQNNVQVNNLVHSLKGISEDFQIRNLKENIKLVVPSSDTFRDFVNFLDNKQLEYFTYQLPADKNLDVVLRHVPIDFNTEEIKEELVRLGYSVQRVDRLRNKGKQPIPVVQVALNKKSVFSREIFGLHFLFNCSIVVEPKRKSFSMLQCLNCQKYGHTKSYCKLKPRCVKCSGNHSTSACLKSKDKPCVCVNCGKEHPANYRGCSYYQDLKSRFGPKPVRQNPHRADQRRLHNPAPPDPSTFPALSSSTPAPVSSQQAISQDHTYAFPRGSHTPRHSSTPNSVPVNSSQSVPNPIQPPPSPTIVNHPRVRLSTTSNFFPSSALGGESSTSIPPWDAIAETVISFLKPLLHSIVSKLKPFLINVISELLNGF